MAPSSRGEILHLPGTTLEGGGQLLRLSIGLAALTSTPTRISNIRGNRSGGGGLKGQHLAAMSWLASACGARVKGMEKKSRELVFIPGEATLDGEDIPAGLIQMDAKIHKTIDIGSPGAVTLVFQAILPYLLCAPASEPVSVTVLGGTNVSNSPSIDYIIHVLLPTLALIGLEDRVHVRLNSRGWSTGQNEMGSVTFTVQPPPPKDVSLQPFAMSDRGNIVKVEAYVLAPTSLHATCTALLTTAVVKERGLGIRLAKQDLTVMSAESGHSKRLYILLVVVSDKGYRLARDWLWGANIDFRSMRSGKKGGRGGKGGRDSKNDEQDTMNTISSAVDEVVQKLADELAHGGCVDEFMRDQLVVFQALAAGKSVINGGRKDDGLVKPSLHAETAHWVAHEMLGVDFEDDGSCNGIGYEPRGTHIVSGTGETCLTARLGELNV